MIADSANPAVDVPALTTSLRGLVDVVVEVAMLERPVHSGMYGGPVGDALTALCRTLATLHDEHGEVAVPGLVHRHAPTRPTSDEATFRADAGLLDGRRADRQRHASRSGSWHKPAVAVLGIDAPRVAEASERAAPPRPGHGQHAAGPRRRRGQGAARAGRAPASRTCRGARRSP